MTSYVQNEDEGNEIKLDIETTKIDKLSQDFNHEFYANTFIEDASYFDTRRPVDLSIGYHHSCVVFDDGIVECSGYDVNGQLGQGERIPSPYNQYYHRKVALPEVVRITDVEVNIHSSCAVDENSELWCWGYNRGYVFGTDSTDSIQAMPMKVRGLENISVDSVSVGEDYQCLLSNESKVYCWGDNGYGKLGIGNHISSTRTPTMVTLPNDLYAIQLDTSYRTSCVLTNEGSVYCWGYNNGYLGNGLSGNSYTPTQVLLPFTDKIEKIKVGLGHSCALSQSGELYCWGHNAYGQLGTESTWSGSGEIYVPVKADVIGDILDFDVGRYHTCVLLTTQSITCWGYNDQGQLGWGSTSDVSGAHKNVNLNANSNQFYDATSIHLGGYSSCAIFDSGKMGCWGHNNHGQFGDGSGSGRTSPYYNKINPGSKTTQLRFDIGVEERKAPYVDGMNFTVSSNPVLPTGFSLDNRTGEISFSGIGNVAVTNHVLTFTAGQDTYDLQISIELSENYQYPERVSGHIGGLVMNTGNSYSTINQISSVEDHTCITQDNRETYCWGEGADYRMGTGSTSDENQPRQMSSDLIKRSQYVTTGTEHTCYLTGNNEVYCLGKYEGVYGQNSNAITNPTKISNQDEKEIKMVVTQANHTCYLLKIGEIHCWGSNIEGQLGRGYENDYQTSPQKVSLPAGSYPISMSVGREFTCSLMSNFSAYCWGANNFGQLGDGTNTDSLTPVKVNIQQSIIALSSGESHTCAILANQDVMCWGRNNVGQLGDNTLIDKNIPVSSLIPTGKDTVQIDAGNSHTCAVIESGEMYCWGLNADSQLADGTTTFKKVPVKSQFPPGIGAVLVASGDSHTCIVSNQSTVYCIGSNDKGQLGDATNTNRQNYVKAKVNTNNQINTIYFTESYEFTKQVIPSGWGQFNISSSPLPQGITLSENATLTYDGESTIGNTQITFFATSGNMNHSISINLEPSSSHKTTGKLDSYIAEAGFKRQSGNSNSGNVISLQSAIYQGCLVTGENTPYCWGNGNSGMNGDRTSSTRTTPNQVYTGDMKDSIFIDGGGYHVCSIDTNSQAWCWGKNTYGQVGDSTNTERNSPVKVKNLESNVIQISVSNERSCALNSNFEIYCWGRNNYGQSGFSGLGYSYTPVMMEGFGQMKPIMISTAQHHTCALIDNGSIACYGRASQGEMGDGSNSETLNQMRWPTLPQGKTAISIDSGYGHICAIMNDLSVYCWGNNGNGQIGNGFTGYVSTPTQILDSSYQVVGISLDYASSCAWLKNGSALCWGLNNYGHLGIGNTTQMNNPAYVRYHQFYPDAKIVMMDMGYMNACALYDNYGVSCWGRNAGSVHGMGDGTANDRNYPYTFVTNFEPKSSVLSQDLTFIQGYPESLKLDYLGWNAEVYASPQLPSGLSFDASNLTLEYDGSNLQSGSFNIFVIDSFGNQTVKINYSSTEIIKQEGRVVTDLLLNSSANEILSNPQVNSIEAGQHHVCITESDGGMKCWGYSNHGQVGYGSTSNQIHPIDYQKNYGSNMEIHQVSLGRAHSCGIDSEDELLCWGYSGQYQNGYNTGQYQYPYKFWNGASNIHYTPIATISAGADYNCAIKYDSNVWCWGKNTHGQVGDGTTAGYSNPTMVDFPSGVSAKSISAGGDHTCIISQDDDLYCWGLNSNGQLGLGNTTSSSYPIKVQISGSRSVLAVSTGNAHTCAILDDYSIQCWGDNDYGQIGDGTTDDRNQPTTVILSGQNDPIQISSGYRSTCALFEDGKLQCWGQNNYGQLGIGSTVDSASPQALTSINHLQAYDITVGENHACALFHDGAPRCWGQNNFGQLGIGSTSTQYEPQIISGYSNSNNSHSFFAGFNYSIPISVAGWNYNSSIIGNSNQNITWDENNHTLELSEWLPVGNYTSHLSFSNQNTVIHLNFSFEIIYTVDVYNDRISSHSGGMSIIDKPSYNIPIEIETGNGGTCFITSNDVNYCQGTGSNGQLGYGSTGSPTTPTKIKNFEEPLKSLSMKYQHSCGIDHENTLWCWGYNQYGQLGIGNTNQYSERQEVTQDITGKELGIIQQVEVGFYYHSCAIIDFSAYCWGYNNYGQLGDSTTSNRYKPTEVSAPDNARFTDLSIGAHQSCGIIENGSVYCWGRNNYGQLGDNSTGDSHLPNYTMIPGNSKAIAITSGLHHSCALMDNNSIYCWGYNNRGQLGDGSYTTGYKPVMSNFNPTSRIVQISAGGEFTCALIENGSIYCWGQNSYNQVEGDESDELSSSTPNPYYVNITENGNFASFDSGNSNICAITKSSDIRCWGSNTGSIDSFFARTASKITYIENSATRKLLAPQGWGIRDYSIANLPPGISYDSFVLEINESANSTSPISWTIDTIDNSYQGSIDLNVIEITTYSGSKSSWTNGISYQNSESELPFIDVDVDHRHSCAIKKNGQLYCWGSNSYGKLGDGTTSRKLSPSLVRFDDEATRVTKVSTGYDSTCTITDESRVMCWGRNQYGELGIGTTENSQALYPVEVLLPWNYDAVDIITGKNYACTLLENGQVWCWGHNTYRQLGNSSTPSNIHSKIPVRVDIPEGRIAVSIKSSQHHTCSIMDDGSMYCWGREYNGNMGQDPSPSDGGQETPLEVMLPKNLRVISMDIGERHGCAALSDNSLYCWGQNQYGQVGVGYQSNTDVSQIINLPQKIDIQNYPPIVDISINYHNSCALHDDGSLTCWGRNNVGQVGEGTTNDISSPTFIQLEGGASASFISVGDEHSCAGANDGTINCWGQGTYLGDGTTEPNNYPGKIDFSEPEFSTVLTYLEGDTTQNEAYIAGWNYSVSVDPELPNGFELDEQTGTIYSTGNSTFGVSRHNLTVSADTYSATVEITIAVIRDTDGDGVPDTEDYDDDDDGHLDSLDNCPVNFGTSMFGGYIGCPDNDGDGWADLIDPFDEDDSQWKDTDGDGYGDNPNGTTPDLWPLDTSQWFDSDGDGYGDNEFGTRGDSCPQEEGYSILDKFGCVDSDADGWSDDGDAFPQTPSQFADRDGDGWGDNQSEGAELVDLFPSDGTQWNDTDGDGHGDNKYGTEGDWFPNDPDRWADTDRDGVADEDDAFVNDATQSSDRDGDLWGDDPLGNRADEFPDDPTEWKDTDGDGVGNNADAFPFDPTQTSDRDGDGYGDNPLGSGADVFPDNPTQWEDKDEDGLGDNQSGTEADPWLNDFDNDGYNDSIDVLPSYYSPGDLDNDGVLDGDDWAPSDPREWADFDNDLIGDNEDPDDDNDGYADTDEIRLKTDPYNKNSVPVESFEIVIPGTNVGLGAWDLIGIFGGVPLFSWIGFGFITRNKRCARYEVMLNECRSRDELEQVALKWEYSLMLRLLGPHQGIRLERLRAELDDHFEKYESTFEYAGEDQTALVEKVIPEISSTVEQDYSQYQAPVATTQHQQNQVAQPAPTQDNVYHQAIQTPQVTQQPTAPQTNEVVQQPVPTVPDPSWQGNVGDDGYEWLTYEGSNYYRLANSQSEWTKWQG